MGECKGKQPAAAARKEDSEIKDVDHEAASSSSATAAFFMSRMLPARVEPPECDICSEPLECSEPAGAAAKDSRLPRLLPCGHSYCTRCVQGSLDINGGSASCSNHAAARAGRVLVEELRGQLCILLTLCPLPPASALLRLLKCPGGCAIDPPQRVDSALKLPKNFALMKTIEAQADCDAMAELAALPCQQCDPTQPRQPAKLHCDDCNAYYCALHDKRAHAVSQLASHQRISIAAHAAQLGAASAAKKSAAFAAAAAASRLTAKAEQGKVDKAISDAKKTKEQLPKGHKQTAMASSCI